VDTLGLLVAVIVHPADWRDCHAAVPLLRRVRRRAWRLAEVWADAAYQPAIVADTCAAMSCRLTIVHTPKGQKTFQIQPIRWIVERTLAWLGKCRSLSKDYEATIQSSEALVIVAMINLMIHRLKPG